MQTSGKKACFQFPECRLSYTKLMKIIRMGKSYFIKNTVGNGKICKKKKRLVHKVLSSVILACHIVQMRIMSAILRRHTFLYMENAEPHPADGRSAEAEVLYGVPGGALLRHERASFMARNVTY